jgi:hypothetical protein
MMHGGWVALPDVGLFDSAIAGETVMPAARISDRSADREEGAPANQEGGKKKRIA